jgi:hypothetical protein
VATGTAPRDWWDEETEVLATVLQILTEHAEAMRGR